MRILSVFSHGNEIAIRNTIWGKEKVFYNDREVSGKRKSEVGKRKAEVGSRKAESGKRKSEVGKRKAEVGKRKAESGKRKADPESSGGSRKCKV